MGHIHLTEAVLACIWGPIHRRSSESLKIAILEYGEDGIGYSFASVLDRVGRSPPKCIRRPAGIPLRGHSFQAAANDTSTGPRVTTRRRSLNKGKAHKSGDWMVHSTVRMRVVTGKLTFVVNSYHSAELFA